MASNNQLTSAQTRELVARSLMEQISALSAIKQKCFRFMMDLSQVNESDRHKEFAIQLVIFLTNVVNHQNHPILSQLEDAFNCILVSYIFDISELTKRELNRDRYEPKHEILAEVNRRTAQYMKDYDQRGFLCPPEFIAFLESLEFS
jgi:hypothetical protein